jgi:hypothetical protein
MPLSDKEAEAEEDRDGVADRAEEEREQVATRSDKLVEHSSQVVRWERLSGVRNWGMNEMRRLSRLHFAWYGFF